MTRWSPRNTDAGAVLWLYRAYLRDGSDDSERVAGEVVDRQSVDLVLRVRVRSTCPRDVLIASELAALLESGGGCAERVATQSSRCGDRQVWRRLVAISKGLWLGSTLPVRSVVSCRALAVLRTAQVLLSAIESVDVK